MDAALSSKSSSGSMQHRAVVRLHRSPYPISLRCSLVTISMKYPMLKAS
ncbi:MAG: hypothetical protein K9M81_04070 [Chthoniobacterales bacterium]|nr:hypothetical protein [Chthoniobacterales bacterium]